MVGSMVGRVRVRLVVGWSVCVCSCLPVCLCAWLFVCVCACFVVCVFRVCVVGCVFVFANLFVPLRVCYVVLFVCVRVWLCLSVWLPVRCCVCNCVVACTLTCPRGSLVGWLFARVFV